MILTFMMASILRSSRVCDKKDTIENTLHKLISIFTVGSVTDVLQEIVAFFFLLSALG